MGRTPFIPESEQWLERGEQAGELRSLEVSHVSDANELFELLFDPDCDSPSLICKRAGDVGRLQFGPECEGGNGVGTATRRSEDSAAAVTGNPVLDFSRIAR